MENKKTHFHWREKCAICKSVITWCKCSGTTVNDMYMRTKWNLCKKCAADGAHKGFIFDGAHGHWKLDPKAPLKTKQFFLQIGDILFYKVDEEEIGQKWTGEFVESGNWKRFTFIPKNELWFDYKLDEYKLKKCALHEYVETMIWDRYGGYDPAHYHTLKLEDFIYNGEGGIDDNIYKLLNN